MAERPRKAFSLAIHSDKEKEVIRDKDNAQPRLKPESAKRPPPNLAPPGMSGIKRGLPAPRKEEMEPPKAGDLRRVFTPLVRSQTDKKRDIDR